jgi:hypothetical protein
MADTVVMGDTDLKSLRTRQIGQCEPPFAMTADGASIACIVRATALALHRMRIPRFGPAIWSSLLTTEPHGPPIVMATVMTRDAPPWECSAGARIDVFEIFSAQLEFG